MNPALTREYPFFSEFFDGVPVSDIAKESVFDCKVTFGNEMC